MSKKNIAAGDEVTGMLRDAIVSGKLKPRERLIEMELASRFGVSRTPVREAIRNLEAAGLVKLEPYKGAIVADINVDEIRDIYAIRVNLEGLATKLASPNIPDEAMKELDEILSRMEQTAESGDVEEFAKGNELFHRTIYKYCGNRLLIYMVDELLERCAIFRRSSWMFRKNVQNTMKTHRELLAALQRRDGALAQQIAENHIRLLLTRNISGAEE